MAEEQGTQISEDQLLEWGNTPLRSEDRAAQAEEAEVVEEEIENTEEESEEEAEVEEYEAPTPVVTVDDPGEYAPGDYSFDVDIDGKTTKITTPEQAADFADEHAEDFTAKQLLQFLRKADKMESRLDRDKEEYERKKTEFDTQFQTEQARQEQISTIASEINYLVSKGKIPAVAKEYQTADWSDAEVKKQPGVKEQVELLNYMRQENDAREKAGLKPLTSAIDAYNAWQLEKNTTSESTKNKEVAAARKVAGSRVAGVSPSPVSIKPKGVSVGRAFSLNDIDSFN